MADDTQSNEQSSIDQSTSQPPDPIKSMDFDVDAREIRLLANDLNDAEAVEADDLETEELAELVAAIKELENAAEDARKEHLEPILADRVPVGSRVRGLKRMEGSNRYVKDNEGAFDAVLEAGEDPREVAKVKVSALEDVLGQQASEFFGESTYDFFRRQE